MIPRRPNEKRGDLMSRENKTEFPRIGFAVTDEDNIKLGVDCIVNAANRKRKTLPVLNQ